MKKRPFLVLSGAFVFGEVCGYFDLTLAAAVLVVLSCAAAVLRRRLVFLVPLLFLTGAVRMEQASAWSPAAAWAAESGETVWVSAEIRVDHIQKREDAFQCYSRDISITYQLGEPGSVLRAGSLSGAVISLENIDESMCRKIRLGDIIRGEGFFRLYDPASNPGQFDARAYYKSLGLEGRIALEQWEWYSAADRKLANLADQGKQIVLRQLEDAAGERDSGLLSAILTGEKAGLSGEDETLFRNNGISHIYAVSGLHISFIGWGLYYLMKKAGGSSWFASLASAVVLGFFVLAVGDGASVIRSYVMFLLSLAAGLMGRTCDMPISLAAACVAVLWERPLMIIQPGFQLSFCAVGGIALAAQVSQAVRTAEKENITETKKRNGRSGIVKLRDNLTVSLWIQLTLLPSTLWHFFQYPCYGIFLNLAVIPMSSIVMTLGFLALGVSFFWMEGAGLCLLPVRGIFWLWRQLCRITSALPGALWVTGRPKTACILIFCAGLLVFYILALRRLRYWKRWYLPALAVFLAVSLTGLTRRPKQGLEIFFLDVGQGDGIYIREEGGHTIMIDGGSSDGWKIGENCLLPAVRWSGADEIDDWFLSHPDQDHMSGLEEALTSGFPIKRLWIPVPFKDHETVAVLEGLAAANGTRIIYTAPGLLLSGEGFSMTCLHPASDIFLSSDNDGSMVLKLEYNKTGILFTGDVEISGEQAILARYGKDADILDCQILKVAHHGSSGSTGTPFLQAVSPELAVISCGFGNSYGHPHQKLLDRLEAQGCRQAVTWEQGAVIIQVQGEKVYQSRWK